MNEKSSEGLAYPHIKICSDCNCVLNWDEKPEDHDENDCVEGKEKHIFRKVFISDKLETVFRERIDEQEKEQRNCDSWKTYKWEDCWSNLTEDKQENKLFDNMDCLYCCRQNIIWDLEILYKKIFGKEFRRD